MMNKHRPNRAPRTERATHRPHAEQAVIGCPGDSLQAALREAELSFALARARLESVRRRLQAKGQAHRGEGGSNLYRLGSQTTRIPLLFSRPKFVKGGSK
jgi:hypothetical protein